MPTLNPTDHPTNTRLLYRVLPYAQANLVECRVAEWSPKGLPRLAWRDGTAKWMSAHEVGWLDVVEVLPPAQESSITLDTSTPDMPLIQTLSQLLRACDVAEQVSVADGVLIARLPARFPLEVRSMLVGRVPSGGAGLECVERLNDALARLHAVHAREMSK